MANTMITAIGLEDHGVANRVKPDIGCGAHPIGTSGSTRHSLNPTLIHAGRRGRSIGMKKTPRV